MGATMGCRGGVYWIEKAVGERSYNGHGEVPLEMGRHIPRMCKRSHVYNWARNF